MLRGLHQTLPAPPEQDRQHNTAVTQMESMHLGRVGNARILHAYTLQQDVNSPELEHKHNSAHEELRIAFSLCTIAQVEHV